ncbi:MAG: hypothetical protein DRI90_05645 [Deltaproteobacteria bacterium]|nr:MAG: hypothetical protein DRI90_05645 [Deltaproteobacteria bacterium]
MSDLFPELRGDLASEAEPASEQEDRRAIRIQLGPAGRVLRGGRYSVDKYNQLLGLPDRLVGDGSLAVTGAEVALGDGRIELTVAGEGHETTCLRLVPCKPTRQHPTSFQVRLHGPVRSGAVRRLMERAERRLQNASFRVLLKVLRLDPERKILTLPRPPAAGCSDEVFERSVVRTYGGSKAWRIFFAALEQQRNYNHQLVGKVLVVKHEDLECSYATPPLGDGSLSFFNYGAPHLGRQRGAAVPERGSGAAAPVTSWGDITTDLCDDDVIKGGAAKVARALDTIAEWDEKPDLVMVKTACVAKVIGDDLSQVMEAFEARTGLSTAYLDNLADEHADFFSTILEQLRWDDEPATSLRRAGRINLVGYPNVPAMTQLEQMLEALGVTINARLVPEIRLDHMERYPQAELQVLFDSSLYQPTFEQLFGHVDLRSIRPTLPYGVNGCRAWLGEVAAALGCEAGWEAIWEEYWAPHAARWSQLTDQARQHRLGFVVDRHSAELLLEPARTTGVPLLALLQEMGFSLELLCYAGADDAVPVASLPGDCVPFHDAAELESLLRQSQATAFYSEYAFDRRLSRCGKAQFSGSDFQLGLAGAGGTLSQLLRICRLPFYRRYARYFGAAFGAESWEPK